ncbi:MAG: kelch repeat-containing protein [Anaerolineales bacterium]
MLTPRSEMPAVEIGGVAYIPGGFSGPLGTARFEAYDIQQNSWQELSSMPAARHHLMASAHNGLLYVFGGSTSVGFNATSTAWRYDPRTNSWEELPPMPEERMSGAAVTLEDTIYIMGGVGGSDQMLAFDPTQLSWQSLQGPQQPREHTTAVPYAGELWAIGGRWAGVGELSSVEIFDPESGKWRRGPSLLISRGGFAAATVGDRVFVAGGEVIMTGNDSLASLEIFDPETDSWEAGPNLPFGVHGLDGVGYDGGFLIFGGSDRAAGIDNEGRVQIYAP